MQFAQLQLHIYSLGKFKIHFSMTQYTMATPYSIGKFEIHCSMIQYTMATPKNTVIHKYFLYTVCHPSLLEAFITNNRKSESNNE